MQQILSQQTVPPYRFAPASPSQTHIYGAERPGYGPNIPVTNAQVSRWVEFMKVNTVAKICCLLDNQHLALYEETPLLEIYEREFGMGNVLHAPVPDYNLCSQEMLHEKILPFLETADLSHHKTVVHCAGGKGRTGHVLAAWLVRKESLTPKNAIAVVESLFRIPREAIDAGNATQKQLEDLIESAGIIDIE